MAGFKLAELFTEIKVRDAGAKRGLSAVKSLAESAHRSMQKVATAGKIAFAALGVAGGLAIRNAAVQEKAEAKLAAVLKATGFAAGFSAEELHKQASALQEVTGIADDAIINTQAILATFKEVRGDEFKDATTAILDMSAVLDQDAKQGAIQLGKALNDPIKGISALSRVGVSFTQQQKDQIKAMQEAGDIAGAQRVILEELKGEFGGAAEAAGNTFAGQVNKLKNDLSDLSEVIGVPLMNALRSGIEIIREWIPSMDEMKNIVVIVAEAVRKMAIFWIDAFASVTVAIRNWREVVSLAAGKVKLFFIKLGEDIIHLFDVDLPRAFMVFGRNIVKIFKNIGEILSTVFDNWGANVRNGMRVIFEILKGNDATFVWVPLTNGLKVELEKWPGLTKRAMTDVEKELAASNKKISDNLGKQTDTLFSSLLKKFGLDKAFTLDRLGLGDKAAAAGAKPKAPPRGGVAAAASKREAAFSGLVGLEAFSNKIQEAILKADTKDQLELQRKQLTAQEKGNKLLGQINTKVGIQASPLGA